MASKSTLFLGDLAAFCTEREIHDVFSPFGEIAEIKIMRSEETMRNLSYGFIKFVSQACAKKAMNALNGTLFCGRHLRVGWAAYRNKKEPKLQHHDKIESSSVHISYISYQLKRLITEESLRILFSSFGVVLDTSIKKSYIDESINRQCGYGFVHFASSEEGIESALAAVAGLNDATIDEVCYKCSISHNLEKQLVEMQQQRIEPTFESYPKHTNNNTLSSTAGQLQSRVLFNQQENIQVNVQPQLTLKLKTCEKIQNVKPLRGGVVGIYNANYDLMQQMSNSDVHSFSRTSPTTIHQDLLSGATPSLARSSPLTTHGEGVSFSHSSSPAIQECDDSLLFSTYVTKRSSLNGPFTNRRQNQVNIHQHHQCANSRSIFPMKEIMIPKDPSNGNQLTSPTSVPHSNRAFYDDLLKFSHDDLDDEIMNHFSMGCSLGAKLPENDFSSSSSILSRSLNDPLYEPRPFFEWCGFGGLNLDVRDGHASIPLH